MIRQKIWLYVILIMMTAGLLFGKAVIKPKWTKEHLETLYVCAYCYGYECLYDYRMNHYGKGTKGGAFVFHELDFIDFVRYRLTQLTLIDLELMQTDGNLWAGYQQGVKDYMHGKSPIIKTLEERLQLVENLLDTIKLAKWADEVIKHLRKLESKKRISEREAY